MGLIKFTTGLQKNYKYNPESGEISHLDHLYFATDTKKILVNGVVYGGGGLSSWNSDIFLDAYASAKFDDRLDNVESVEEAIAIITKRIEQAAIGIPIVPEADYIGNEDNYPDKVIVIPDLSPEAGSGSTSIELSGNGTYVQMLFNEINNLRNEIQKLRNSFKYGINSYDNDKFGETYQGVTPQEPIGIINLKDLTLQDNIYQLMRQDEQLGTELSDSNGWLTTTNYQGFLPNVFLDFSKNYKKFIVNMKLKLGEKFDNDDDNFGISLNNQFIPQDIINGNISEEDYNNNVIFFKLSDLLFDYFEKDDFVQAQLILVRRDDGICIKVRLSDGAKIIGKSITSNGEFSDLDEVLIDTKLDKEKNTEVKLLLDYYYNLPQTIYIKSDIASFYSVNDDSIDGGPINIDIDDYKYKAAALTIRSVQDINMLSSSSSSYQENELIYQRDDGSLHIKTEGTVKSLTNNQNVSIYQDTNLDCGVLWFRTSGEESSGVNGEDGDDEEDENEE